MANAGSSDITGFHVAADGVLTLLDADGVTGQATAGAADQDVTDDNEFLYVVNNGSDSFSIFQIEADTGSGQSHRPSRAGPPGRGQQGSGRPAAREAWP